MRLTGFIRLSLKVAVGFDRVAYGSIELVYTTFCVAASSCVGSFVNPAWGLGCCKATEANM